LLYAGLLDFPLAGDSLLLQKGGNRVVADVGLVRQPFIGDGQALLDQAALRLF